MFFIFALWDRSGWFSKPQKSSPPPPATSCEAIAEELRTLQIPVTIDIHDIRREKTKAESILVIKALLADFGVSEECIIRGCEEAQFLAKEEGKTISSPDWALCKEMTELYGDTDRDFTRGVPEIFHDLLVFGRGFWTDWRYSDDTVLSHLNRGHLLKRYGLDIVSHRMQGTNRLISS